MMERGLRLTVVSAPFCPVAEAVLAVLWGAVQDADHRKTGASVAIEARLSMSASVRIEGAVPVLELADDLTRTLQGVDPIAKAQARQLRGHILRAFDRLPALLAARDGTDFDIAVHLLRVVLAQVNADIKCAKQIEAGSLPALIYALIWRLRALDSSYASFLLDGFDDLSAWARGKVGSDENPKSWPAHVARPQGFIAQLIREPA